MSRAETAAIARSAASLPADGVDDTFHADPFHRMLSVLVPRDPTVQTLSFASATTSNR